MKLAVTLIIIGAFLLAEGGSRIMVGMAGNAFPVIVGILTGIVLGGYLQGVSRG